MRKTYVYRLYVSKRDKHLLKIIHSSASIWNHCIALHKKYYKLFGVFLNQYKLMKHIAKLRRKNSYWKLIPSQAVQDIISRIDKSYKQFFRDIKAGRKASPPNFKKSTKYKSFTLKQAGWKLRGQNKIRIGKHNYKFVLSHPIKGKIQTVTIKRDKCGDLWIHFSCKEVVQEKVYTPTGKSVGIDVGLKTFLTLSNGEKVDSPRFFKDSAAQIKAANRSLARKQKGSKNWEKAKKYLAKIQIKVANKRNDFQWKLANSLVKTFDSLFFETLNFKGMQQLWGKKIGDLAIYSFLQKVEHLSTIHHRLFGQIDRWYPSSKLCSCCEYKNDYLSLKDRFWTCPKCTTQHDRDLNAATNIKYKGARTFAPDLVAVRPSLLMANNV